MGLKPSTIPVQMGDQKLMIGGDSILEVEGISISTEIEAMRKIRERVAKRLASH